MRWPSQSYAIHSLVIAEPRPDRLINVQHVDLVVHRECIWYRAVAIARYVAGTAVKDCSVQA